MTRNRTNTAADLQDEALEGVQGGADLKLAMATKFGAPTATVEVVAMEEELMALRKRPTRIEKDPMDGVEEAGVLRRRPTR